MSIPQPNVAGGAIVDGGGTTATPYVAATPDEVANQDTQITALQTRMTAVEPAIVTVTATMTIGAAHRTVLVDASSGAVVINLPAASLNANRILNVKKIDASANTVTIDPNSSETIDGATTKVISTQWTNVRFQCNGTAWFII